jgi:hypothetical protein
MYVVPTAPSSVYSRLNIIHNKSTRWQIMNAMTLRGLHRATPFFTLQLDFNTSAALPCNQLKRVRQHRAAAKTKVSGFIDL